MLISDYVIKRLLNGIEKLNRYNSLEIQYIKYFLQTVLWETEKIIFLFIFFGLFGKTTYFVLDFIALITIRVNAGGQHNKSSLSCLLYSLSAFSLAIFVFPEFGFNLASFILIIIFSLIVTLMCAPIYTIQKEQLMKETYPKRKILSLTITLLWFIGLAFLNFNTYAVSASWMIFIQNVQLLCEYIKRRCCVEKELSI